jgi:phospholipid/cholesterol/gamma-HCH transport system ATP-binding protein
MIRIVNLVKKFGPLTVLDGVNLEIQDKNTTTVLGLSGSGKSTILKHIIGLMKPTSGEIYVGEQEVTRLKGEALDEVRRKFGVVFQSSALLQSLTVYENVALPLRERHKYSLSEIDDRVSEKIRLVRLAESDWHKVPSELSGGMRKRSWKIPTTSCGMNPPPAWTRSPTTWSTT